MNADRDITFTPMTDDDLEFSYRVYADSRREEMALTGWTDQQQEQFLRMQFELQHQYYREQFPEASFDVILKDGEPIGRLYIRRQQDTINVIDIALLSEHRGTGIGGRLMQDILDEGRDSGRSVCIHVMQNNRARNLYDRLGFQPVEEVGAYWRMQWDPNQSSAVGEGG